MMETQVTLEKEELLLAHNQQQNILPGSQTSIFKEIFKNNLESAVNSILHIF